MEKIIIVIGILIGMATFSLNNVKIPVNSPGVAHTHHGHHHHHHPSGPHHH